ncbi:MAG: bifunctional tetrahydrofolate synthase/dihydrofolate synthase [Steroidobacteraceae bacterium]|jgi:dihydrofolate synthase/folylpolyglutamate synthase|nr:bifunctional tetrahydrofolate synthase/dihydrofolate synthase [Steroidobacteraceae bacterium]
MRSLADWLEYQQRQHVRSIDLGLGRVGEVARRLGSLPLPCPVVLVAGTNGKGSTVAHAAAQARAAGLVTGTFTSPHLVRYNERIAIDGRSVGDDELVAAFERIEAARGEVPLTFFEYNTLAAFEVFARRRPALAVVEVGLGGRLDATNLLDADVAVISSIGLDHTDWLGPTLEHIGAEKAGILRAGRAAILGASEMPRSVHAAIESVGADARWPGRDFAVSRAVDGQGRWDFAGRHWRFVGLPPPALPGEIQYHNAAAALAALEALAASRPALLASLDAGTVAAGLRAVRLPGRFQVLPGPPEWILDVAHNEPAAVVLADNLRARPSRGRTLAIAGILGDKDVAAIGRVLGPCIDEWILCGLQGPRGLSAQALRERLAPVGDSAALVPDVGAACALARARAGEADRVVVLGSFHTVGPALEWLGL